MTLVNEQKAMIDELQDKISNLEMYSEENESHKGKGHEETIPLVLAMEDAKRKYRELFTEMALCKNQVLSIFVFHYSY